jgi:putative tryptophan/tyrosine transport system substrate-binding protein
MLTWSKDRVWPETEISDQKNRAISIKLLLDRMRVSCLGDAMRRRDFIKSVVGAAVAAPLTALAQQAGRLRHIGVLVNLAMDDPLGQARQKAFVEGLRALGWTEGRDVQIDTRWGGGDADQFRKYAAELIALQPDVLLATSGATMPALMQATRTVPIVFVQVPDPVGSGFVASLARPGGNATGFTQFDFSLSGKWLEVLKEIAPLVTRVAVLRDPADPAGTGQFGAIQIAAPSFGMEVRPIDVREPVEIKSGIAALASEANGGLIVTGSAPAAVHRDLIIKLAAQHRLPAVYPYRFYAADGGLVSYGPDTIDPYRRAASYVDRILKGEKPADLPVQAPTKYELVINRKAAKSLDLALPQAMVARADEVID